MSRVWRVAAALTGLILSAPVAAAQDVDAIGALLDQAQPASEAIPTPPTAPPAPALGTPAPTVAPVPSAPVATAPPFGASPPPAAYIPPPVYSSPPAVQPPLPYVNTPPVYRPPVYTPPAYIPPPYVAPTPRRPRLTAPVHIDEIGKTPEAPPTAVDLSYEARMRSSFNSAQGLQGPLDGAWTLRAGGSELYDLQLVDSGSGNLEGAWRDPRRRGATDASGFIDTISRVGGQLVIRLTPRPGAEPSILMLNADSNGTWSGELTERGERRSVTMRRN
ncbi:hypothetical protein [Phenylobacterium sp.]|uniref:hypothetical protein n=1 Tax=Phenylobacterium sp. TaxID=1871053 RepID=UPI00286DA1D7|nr:hypothetical protein [Phenylobacterium sp.]